jgi:hypothetical protein
MVANNQRSRHQGKQLVAVLRQGKNAVPIIAALPLSAG